MPIYDYHCSECNTIFDVFHKGREIVEDVICPSCGSRKYRKLISVPVVSLSVTPKNKPFSSTSSCETGECCGGACGLN